MEIVNDELTSKGNRPKRHIVRKSILRREYIEGYIFTLPAILFISVFILIPVFYGLYLSMTNWDGYSPAVFIGIKNYINLFKTDDIFRKDIFNNVKFAIAVVTGKNILGLLLALLANMKLRGVTFFRTVLFLPVTMSFVAIGILWAWIYNPQFGLISSGLHLLGLDQFNKPWLGLESTALWAIVVVDIWKWTGFHMVLYLAGLQGIPIDLYEAAMVDGALSFDKFRYITLPLLAPIVFINILMSLSGAFVTNFDLVWVMTGGGPNHASEVVLTRMVLEAFQYGRLGYSSAMGYVLFIIVGIISFFYIRMARSGNANQ